MKVIKNQDVEYIVIDGVSTDGTLELIESRGELVDHLVSEPDRGIYDAMNKGVRLASGKYTLFINGDDELVSDGFPSVLERLKRDNADVVSATTLVGSRSEPDEVLVARPFRLPFHNTVPHPSSFVRTSMMRERCFDETLKIAADYDFFLWALMAGKKFATVPAVTAVHNRGGASGDQLRSQQEIEQVRRKRLGWVLYALTNLIAGGWRMIKRISRLR